MWCCRLVRVIALVPHSLTRRLQRKRMGSTWRNEEASGGGRGRVTLWDVLSAARLDGGKKVVVAGPWRSSEGYDNGGKI